MEITYLLSDNGGISTIYLPILLKTGTIFEHEFGTYKVEEIRNFKEGTKVLCERL